MIGRDIRPRVATTICTIDGRVNRNGMTPSTMLPKKMTVRIIIGGTIDRWRGFIRSNGRIVISMALRFVLSAESEFVKTFYFRVNTNAFVEGVCRYRFALCAAVRSKRSSHTTATNEKNIGTGSWLSVRGFRQAFATTSNSPVPTSATPTTLHPPVRVALVNPKRRWHAPRL